MAAQAVAVTMIVAVIVIARMVVPVTFVSMGAGFLGFVVHQPDSNRDLVCLIAWIRSASMANNGVNRGDRRERTRWPKRN
jgi:hypothetical protein